MLKGRVTDVVGAMQLKTGRPPTVIGTPRMALEQWKYVVRNVPEPRKGTLMLIATRNRRWVEWATFSACYLLQMGYRPILVYSSSEIDTLYSGESADYPFWEGVVDTPFVSLIDIDPFLDAATADPYYAQYARRNAHMLAAYDLRIEEFEPGDAEEPYKTAVNRAEAMLQRHATAFETLLDAYPTDRIICPSGIIANTRAYYAAASRKDITAVYVEGWSMRPGHNVWNVNRPALHYDIEGWLKVLGEWDETKEQEAADYIAFREGNEVNGDDWLDNFHQVQRSTKDAQLPIALAVFFKRPGKFFLLGSNVVGDSATLGRATVFRSQRDWIETTVAFFKGHPEYNLVVRAHPDEAVKQAKVCLGQVAETAAENADNIYVVHGEDDVNTYALVDHIDVGLAWVSNIGLDMAIRGKPVVLAANAQYSGLGVCREPSSRDDYFAMLESLAANPQPASAEAIRRGKAYHYIVFKMMSLESDSRRYDATDYRLNDPNEHPDRRQFYHILAGELNDKGLSAESRSYIDKINTPFLTNPSVQ